MAIRLHLLVVILAFTVACTQCVCFNDEARNSWAPESIRQDDGDLETEEYPSWICNGKTIPGLKCESNEASLLVGYCATYQQTPSNFAAVGRCTFIKSPSNVHILGHVYSKLPMNISRLNSFMCGALNRTGILCGKCEPGLGPTVLSYSHKCRKCLPSPYGWLLYVGLACVPSIIFFFVVIFFQVRATSASLNFYIFICHFVAQYMNVFLSDISVVGRIIATTYSLWNLEFLYLFLPEFCVSESLSLLHVVMMKYLVAFLPLCLITLTYFLMELYAYDCRIIVFLCKPFTACFIRLRRRWDPRGSIVHTFATFLLLSYTKLTGISCVLLARTGLHITSRDSRGDMYNVVYLHPSIRYFSAEHLPSALLALTVLCALVVLPLLFLCLYPSRLFQRCLYKCRLRWHGLHAFAEAFNGCYKDGTKGTRDYRYFGGMYLFLRIAIVACFYVEVHYIWLLVILVFSTQSLLFTVLQPYKDSLFNAMDGLLAAIAACIVLLSMFEVFVASVPSVFYYAVLIPFFYFILYVLSKILLQTRLLRRATSSRCWKVRKLMERIAGHHSPCGSDARTQEGENDSLPHRLTCPEQYRNYGAVRTSWRENAIRTY